MYNSQYLQRQYQNKVNNAQGHLFEEMVKAGCNYYRERGQAEIKKIPEDFRVIRKEKKYGKYTGKFEGYFIENAQPDFQGTLKSGQSIVFETKYTSKDRISQNVLTETQKKLLQSHTEMGAACYVLVEINSTPYMVPWKSWNNMEKIYGKKSVNKENLWFYEVKRAPNGAVLFLDQKNEEREE